MMGTESLRMAMQALWSHKLRSALTVLGVVIGVGSVIAVTSLGAAFEESITSQFDDVDDRSIFVTAGQTEGVGNGPPDAGQFGLVFTEVDRRALLDLDGVERVIVSGQAAVTNLRYDGKDLQFRSFSATTQDADEVRDLDAYLVGGPFEDGQRQIVLGYAIAKQLSGAEGDDELSLEVGDQVTVTLPDGSDVNVRVAGVLARDDTLFGTLNGQVFAPVDPFYTTERRSPSTDQTVRVFDGFTVVAATGTDVDDVREQVADYMENDSDAAALLEDIDDFGVLVATASDITGQISSAFDQVTLFIAAIAGVSLLVGGIMIGTILLISVAERTKEIGMMKAIGALDRDILGTFLLEAALVGLAGSLVGIALGLGGGYALVDGLFGDEDVSFVVPWDWVAVSVLVGVGTGVVAGLLPARRALKIQPVEALGYE
ncbi:MAG: ABC transporter permease [Thermoplasmatota archaeon]